jgi:flagellar biosynthetic protein FlhB
VDRIAERIREIAREHRVPVYEDPPLAWALYRAVEIGREIPADLYRVVAGVLAHVYRLRGRRVPSRTGATP